MADDKEKQKELDEASLKAIQQQNESAKELLSTYEKLKKTKRSLTDDEKATLDISKQLIQSSKTLEASIQARNNESSTSKQLSEVLNKLQKDYDKNLANSGNTIKKLNDQKSAALKAALQAARSEKDIQRTLTEELIAQDEILDEINRLKSSGASAKDLADARQNLQLVKQSIKDLEKGLEKTIKIKEEQKNLVKQLDEAKNTHEETIKQQEQELELLKKETAQKTILNAADKVGNALGLDKLKNALSLSGIFGFILDSIFKIDKQITGLSKSLGVSKDSARAMRDDMFAYSLASNDSFVNVDRLMKAQQGLTEQLGIAVDFGREEQETFARLTELMGLSAEEAGKLAQNSAVLGMSTKDYVADVRNAAFQAQLETNTRIEDKKLMQDLSKLSSDILVKYKGNVDALGKALVQANKLGLSLNKVNDIGNSLLDWESSINNELEAELLTGKKINLERAREAALTGDQATLMQEISAQAGSLADFQNMNVLAQQSLAKAFGMNADEMAEMLMKQEAINTYGSEAANLNKEQLEDMERRNMSAAEYQEYLQNQRDTQEKFNDVVLKLQEAFAQIAEGPLGTLVSMLADMLGSSTGMYSIFIALGAYMAGSLFMSLAKVGKLLKAQKAESLGAAIISVVKGAWESMGPIPFVGAALAAVAAAAGIAYLYSQSSKKADDMVSYGGYGNRTLLTPKGSIKLNNEDTIIAGTDKSLKGGVKQQPSASPGIAAMGAMVGAIGKLAAASDRPAVAYINGRDAFANNLGGTNALGTSQMQNSYKYA